MKTKHESLEGCGPECPRCSKVAEVIKRFGFTGRPTSFSPLYQIAEHVVDLEEDAISEKMRKCPCIVESSAVFRDVVWRFALLMEKRLRENEHKGGWEDERMDWLFARLLDEAGELEAEMNPNAVPRQIAVEAADVANFAMMIADNCGGLK